jgi:chemotaxis regulatin CheY-phosphate phosphatase CheZ
MKPDRHLITIEPATVPAGDVLVYEYGCRLDEASARHADEQIRQARGRYNAMVELMQQVHAEMSAWTLERAGPQAQQLDAAAQAATTAYHAALAQPAGHGAHCPRAPGLVA